jgi:hypothetical protein
MASGSIVSVRHPTVIECRTDLSNRRLAHRQIVIADYWQPADFYVCLDVHMVILELI